jgi:hypothetical protein
MACLTQQSLDQFLQAQANLSDGPAVIKVHEVGPLALEWIRAKRAKAVCTFRDPRDCVASDMVFWGAGFDASVQRVVISLKTLHASYLDVGSTLFVRYEDMMNDTLSQIRRIAEYLNVAIDQKEVERIDAQTNIQSSRQICLGLDKRPDSETDVGTGGHRRHRVTLLHDNHIGNAKVGRWKDELTDEQGERLTHLFQPSLQALGYSIEGSVYNPSPIVTWPNSASANTNPVPPS